MLHDGGGGANGTTSLSLPKSSLRSKSRRSDHDPSSSSLQSSPFAITRRAVLELPVDLHVESNNTFGGLSLRPASKLTLHTSFPLIGSLSASLDAKAGVRGRTGYSAAKTGLTLKLAPHQKLSAVSHWDQNGTMQSVTLSAQTTQPETTNLQVSLQSHNINSKLEDLAWRPTLTASKPLTDVLVLRTQASLTPLTLAILQATSDYTQQVATQLLSTSDDSTSNYLTLADCPVQPTHYGVSLESQQSRHAWSLGLSHSRQHPYQLQWSLSPRLYQGRTLGLSGSYRLFSSGAAATLSGLQFVWAADKDNNKTASPLALSQVKLHVSDSSSYNSTMTGSGAWAWVVSITTRGDFTFRVPIVIATSALADPLVYPVQALYVGAVSWLVQELAVRLLTSFAASSSSNRQAKMLSEDDKDRRKRERQVAENQQSLMKFQASRRKTAEKEANGLVINVAVYYTAKEKLDVTIPLRFWVSESSLVLAESSKSKLLGFYDMSTEKKSHRRRKQPSWISGFWRKDSSSSLSSSSRVTPKLSIEYTYRGASYQMTIEDDEELVLPNDRARLVRAAAMEQ